MVCPDILCPDILSWLGHILRLGDLSRLAVDLLLNGCLELLSCCVLAAAS